MATTTPTATGRDELERRDASRSRNFPDADPQLPRLLARQLLLLRRELVPGYRAEDDDGYAPPVDRLVEA